MAGDQVAVPSVSEVPLRLCASALNPMQFASPLHALNQPLHTTNVSHPDLSYFFTRLPALIDKALVLHIHCALTRLHHDCH
ncbi:hypothetical protein DES53_107169 [Roseimicrobium gellanilyticum]|uniref:Uncharacterized protein n=1 Tax=Roseimicrobium gellanilyticum TaxID=748857 RepID=A0A366HFQ2_9BACT|nr:hypothetical protein DES53_107169 [Roseimicrobium gellanilyticum]